MGAFLGHPLVEFRGDVGDEKSIEKIAAIESECVAVLTGVAMLFEDYGVAPELRAIHGDLFFAARQNDSLAQRSPQKMERLSQRPSRVDGVQLGPQEGNYRIAPAEARSIGKRQVRDQGESLRLRDQRPERFAVRTSDVQAAQRAQFDHGDRGNGLITPE
jgi:hypothetical protein